MNLRAKGYRILDNVVASKTRIIRQYMASSAKSHFSFLALQSGPRKCCFTPLGAPGEAMLKVNKRKRTLKSICFRRELFKRRRRKEERILNRMKERLKMLILSKYRKSSKLAKCSKKQDLFLMSSPPPTPKKKNFKKLKRTQTRGKTI